MTMKKPAVTLTLSQIYWDINTLDVASRLNALGDEAAAKALGISLEEYRSFGDAGSEVFRKFASENVEKLYEFMGLPTEVVVPDKIASTGDAADVENWLSEEYGYTFDSYVEDRSFSQERAVELLNYLLEYEAAGRSVSEMVDLLMNNGFERSDLLCLGYDKELIDDDE